MFLRNAVHKLILLCHNLQTLLWETTALKETHLNDEAFTTGYRYIKSSHISTLYLQLLVIYRTDNTNTHTMKYCFKQWEWPYDFCIRGIHICLWNITSWFLGTVPFFCLQHLNILLFWFLLSSYQTFVRDQVELVLYLPVVDIQRKYVPDAIWNLCRDWSRKWSRDEHFWSYCAPQNEKWTDFVIHNIVIRY